MSYEVVKTINGRRYKYRQRSYRQDGKVKTESVYLGPVDGEERRGRVTEFFKGLVRIDKDQNYETEEMAKSRVAVEDREREKRDHINDLLTAPTISLDSINEIAASQAATSSSEPAQPSEQSPNDAGEKAS